MAIRYLSGVNIDSNTLFVDDVNNRVGVGTGSPAYTLDIATSSSPTVRITRNGATDLRLGASIIGTGALIGTYSNSPMSFLTNSVVQAVITEAGNVGIGTTSPGYKLEVYGSARVNNTLWVNNSNGTATVNAYSGGQTGTYLAKSSSATANFTTTGVSYPRGLGFGAIIGQGNTTDIPVNNASWNGGYGGNVGFWSDVHYGVEGGTNSIGFNAVIKGSGNSNSYGFFSDLSGVTDGVRYGIYTKGEQQNYFSGNVGIGTTSPAQKLTVSGSTGDMLGITNGTTTGYGYVDNNGFGLFTSSGAGGTGIYYRTANIIDHYVNGSIAMRLNSTSNVGIGTTSPSEKLSVVGNVSVTSGEYRLYNNSTVLSATSGSLLSINAGGFSNVSVVNGNFGIGTASPAYKLDVAGTISNNSEQNFIYATYDDVAALFQRVGTFGSVIRIGRKGVSNSTTIDYPADGTFAVSTGGSERMRITAAGNVGIGTTSPSYKLDVNGDINASSGVYRIGGSTILSGTTSVVVGSSGATGSVTLRTTSGDGLVLNGSNVGIGTTSPSYKASIVAANGNYWNGTAFTGTPLALSIENSQAGGYDPVLIYNQADSGGTLKNSGAIGMVGTGPWTAGNNASQVSDMYFLVRNSSGSISERLRIKSTGAAQLKAYGSGSFTGTVAYNLAVDSSGNIIETAGGVVDGSGTANYVSKWSDANTLTDSIIYDNGTNVGIGTTSPLAKLQVSGGRAYFFSGDNYSVGLAQTAAQGNYMYLGTASDGTFYISETSGTARVTVQQGGNVGIGTTAPASLLHVNGTFRSNAFFTLSNGISYWGPNGVEYGYLTWDTGYAKIGASGSNTLYLGGGNQITILNGGNVGIGTTSPAYKLDVSGQGRFLTTASEATIIAGGASLYNTYIANSVVVGYIGSGQGMVSGGGATNFGVRAESDLLFASGGNAERMRITSAGNVGIGTTSPSYKLEVSGKIYSTTEIQANTAVMNTTGGYASFGSNSGSTPVRVSRDASLSDIIIDASGNVGIGTTGPTQKLQVNGSLRVTGAYYDSSNSAGSSGQVLSSTGSGTDWVSLSEITGVDGTGTANYIAKWSDTDTITNSQVFDNGTNVGINNASPKTKLDVNGTIGFGSKTLNISDTFVTVLTVNMSNHTGCYVKITAFGDWSAHSAVAYLGEFFLQNGASAYNEPGVIIRQVDNTNTDDIVAQIVDPAGTGTRDFEIQLKTTSASGVPFSAAIQYEVRGQYNSVS